MGYVLTIIIIIKNCCCRAPACSHTIFVFSCLLLLLLFVFLQLDSNYGSLGGAFLSTIQDVVMKWKIIVKGAVNLQ